MCRQVMSLISRLRETELSSLAGFEGCSEDQISQVAQAQGIETLPEVYRDILSLMGRRAGRFLVGSEAYYPEIMGLRSAAESLLRENRVPYCLPANAFVFLMHQGYFFCYFLCGGTDDPAVYYYCEGDVAPKEADATLSAYFLKMVEDEHDAYKGLR